jgi:hypothetical protein
MYMALMSYRDSGTASGTEYKNELFKSTLKVKTKLCQTAVLFPN